MFYSTQTPIWHNPDFTANKLPLTGTEWEKKGITHLHHIFDHNTLLTFQQLMDIYDIPKQQYLQYIQLKHSIKSKIDISSAHLEQHPLLDSINKIAKSNKPLSKLYKLISSTDPTDTPHIPINKWEKDLNIHTDNHFWNKTCNNIFSMSTNTNLRLIQYKIIHRTHITQHKKHIMGLTGSDICTECTLNKPNDYFHALWLCPPIQHFWREVTTRLSQFLGCYVPLSPSICILGNLEILNTGPTQTTTRITTPLLVALTIAKKTILLNWKSRKKINISQWFNLLIQHILMEQESAQQNNQLEEFNKTYSVILEATSLPAN